MNDTKLVALLLVFLFMAVGILTWYLATKSLKKNHQYDETQKLIRGKGYKAGFFVTIISGAIMMFLVDDIVGIGSVVEPSVGIFMVIMAGVVTFAVYCILNDAFKTIKDSSNRYLILYSVIGLMNLVSLIPRLVEGSFFEDGRLTFEHGGANLICVIGFLIIVAAMLIKKGKDKEEAGE